MEWRTTTMSRSLQFLTMTLVLAAAAPAARASGVFDPDQGPAVSRFGEFTDRNGRIVRAADQVRQDDEEDLRSPVADTTIARSPASATRDTISTHAAARARAANTETPPLGTLRRNGVQEVAVIAGDLGFFPRTVFVTQDIPVRMFVTGASKNALCIMMDSFNVRKQVKSQTIEEVSFTPERPGKFRFYCPVNGAEGFVVVREFGRGEDS